MPTKQVIGFVEANSPVKDPVTKFGGQPNWISTPTWPLSKQTGNPMRFICQVALDQMGDLVTPSRMAYLFMTDEEDGEYVDGTWEPDGGENAVVLQPGECDLPHQEIEEGPTLYRMVKKEGHDRLLPQSCEFAVSVQLAEDVAYITEEELWKLPEEARVAAVGEFGGMQNRRYPRVPSRRRNSF